MCLWKFIITIVFQPQDKSLSLSSSFQGSTLSTPSSSQSSLPGGSSTGKYRFSPQLESTPTVNGHSESREGDREISDIVGADNTLPPYSAPRGKFIVSLERETEKLVILLVLIIPYLHIVPLEVSS